MRVAVTGGTGLVGRFLVEGLVAAGCEVVLLARRPPPPGLLSAPVEFRPFDLLGPPPPLVGTDALVHAALSHVAGQYRGGEGDDPAGFAAANRDGTLRLMEAAAAAGVGRILLLSSRAVYGAYPPGTALDEAMAPRPDTLYGRVKLQAEEALARLPLAGVSLRATGVYGPAGAGQSHKWAGLLRRFGRGETPAPRAGTEIHGADLAAAAGLLLAEDARGVFNASDILLDRRDLLAEAARLTGWRTQLPERAATPVSAMDTGRLRALGWRPGGLAGLRAALPEMIAQALGAGPERSQPGSGRRP